jgi:hypothetical protein
MYYRGEYSPLPVGAIVQFVDNHQYPSHYVEIKMGIIIQLLGAPYGGIYELEMMVCEPWHYIRICHRFRHDILPV